MNDTAPLPPPDADAVAATGETTVASPVEPRRLSHPAALLALSVGVGSAIAIALGFGVGFAVMASAEGSCSPHDGWCGLGAALAGMFFGGIAALVGYIVAGVVTIRRFRPKGERGSHIAAHLAFPVAAWTALFLLNLVLGTLLNW